MLKLELIALYKAYLAHWAVQKQLIGPYKCLQYDLPTVIINVDTWVLVEWLDRRQKVRALMCTKATHVYRYRYIHSRTLTQTHVRARSGCRSVPCTPVGYSHLNFITPDNPKRVKAIAASSALRWSVQITFFSPSRACTLSFFRWGNDSSLGDPGHASSTWLQNWKDQTFSHGWFRLKLS